MSTRFKIEESNTPTVSTVTENTNVSQNIPNDNLNINQVTQLPSVEPEPTSELEQTLIDSGVNLDNPIIPEDPYVQRPQEPQYETQDNKLFGKVLKKRNINPTARSDTNNTTMYLIGGAAIATLLSKML